MVRLLILFCSALLLVVDPFTARAQRTCTAADYTGEYTECRNGQRNAIYYKKPDAQCVGGAQSPPNVFDLPCDISCRPGEYLKFGSTSALGCERCAAGTYSLGGSTRIDDEDWSDETAWSNFGPSGVASFRTWCIDTRDPLTFLPASICPGWRMVDGAYTESYGNKTADYQESVLEMTVRLVRDGSLTVEYLVDAEQNYDLFSIYIDDVQALGGISHQLEFTRFTKEMISGVHNIKFKFTKDFSLSEGRNAALIRMIEISGTTYADSECYPCHPGTHYNTTGASRCESCPLNTFAADEGAVECQPCESTQFAYPGSKVCLPRSPCHESDWYTFYTPCRSDGLHDLRHEWLEPMICDPNASGADQKPGNTPNVQCARCNPGYVRNQHSVCEACPANTYTTDGVTCLSCPTGYIGRRDFTWQNFEEYPEVDFSTRCDGTCGSNGWRLTGHNLDSGIGHGAYVDVSFSLRLNIVASGHVSFDFSFACERSCHLSFVDETVESDGSRLLRTSRSFYNFWSDDGLMTYTTIPGDHFFTWYFSQYDPMLLARNDRVIIRSINVTDVAAGQGGASQCALCGAGTKANPATSVCELCPEGHTSSPMSTQCFKCPANTFAENQGSVVCEPCGAGTTSDAGAKLCTPSCEYNPPGSTFHYDLRPLSPSNDTTGPIQDTSHREYRFNLCARNMEYSCRNEDGVYVQSHVCQTERGRGADAGHIMEYVGGQNGTGVTLHFSRGDEGCGYGYYGTGARPRTSEIRLICDPDVIGAGVPTVVSADYPIRCSYVFEWRTIFACPVCTRDDYDFYYTECKDGKRDTVFFWKDNPKRCHGGVPLPTTRTIECSLDDTTVCPAGTRKAESCVACDAGSYSLGGAVISQSWLSFPDNFRSFCSGCRAMWAPRGSFAESGSAGSVLQAIYTFVRPGNFSFTYSAVFAGGEYLHFSMDGVPIIRDRRWSTLRESRVDVVVPTPGAHVFTWEFRRNSSAAATGLSGYVKLTSVIAVGTRFHDLSCTKCQPGYFAPEDGAKGCFMCPANTYSDVSGRSECKSCAADQWAPPGSSRCLPKPVCGESDYSVSHTACTNGVRTKTYTLIQPSICREVSGGLRPVNVSCSCPIGTRLDSSDNCVGCADGSYIPLGSNQCVSAAPGTFARRTLRLMAAQARTPTLPAAAITYCSGTCLSTWRTTSAGLDSGVQVGDSSSSLTVPVEVVSHGATAALSFSFSGSAAASMQVLVDSNLFSDIKPATSKRAVQTAEIPLSLGRHNLTLNFISPGGGDPTTRSFVTVSSLDIVGASSGGAEPVQCPPGSVSSTSGSSSCAPCPAGTAAEQAGSSTCSACPAGTFSSDIGSPSCISCGTGSFTNGPGSSTCSTGCTFATANGTRFDLRQLTERTVYDLRNSREIIFNPCGNKSRLGCDSYVCTRTPDHADTVIVGRNPDFTSPAADSDQWLLTYADGYVCPSTGERSHVTVRFRCDLSNPNNLGEPRVVEADDCTIFLEWVTPAACPACSTSDFTPVYGKCEAGVQRVTYVAPSTCYNSGFDQPKTEESGCNAVEFPLVAVVVALVVFVGLVVVLVVVWMKNRRLYAEYSLLKDAHMDQLDNQLETSTQLDTELEEDNRL